MNHLGCELLADLEDAGIHFTLGRHRDETVLASLTLAGERVESDVFDDGHTRWHGSKAWKRSSAERSW